MTSNVPGGGPVIMLSNRDLIQKGPLLGGGGWRWKMEPWATAEEHLHFFVELLAAGDFRDKSCGPRVAFHPEATNYLLG